MTRPLSLAQRVALSAMAAVLLAGAIAGLLSHRASLHEADELFDARLAQTAQTLSEAPARPGDFGRRGMHDDDDEEEDDWEEEIEAPRTTLHPYQSRVMYQVWREGMGRLRLVLRTANAPAAPLARRWAAGFDNIALDGETWRLFTLNDGDTVVTVGESLAVRGELARKIAWRNTLPFLMVTPLLAFLASWAVRRTLAPLRQLASELDHRQPEHLDPLEIPAAPDELQPIVKSLNDLLARVSSAMERERRLTSDAAHELRTPLAGLAAQLDAGALAGDAEELRASLLRARQGVTRLGTLTDRLLTLARLDAANVQVDTRADLALAARTVCADLAPMALSRDVEMSLAADTTASVRGQAEWLEILVRNLVDNALRHAPPDGQVEVAVTKGSHGIQLSVADNGPGVPDAELSRLGERFHRLAPDSEEGTGLGLSIVRRIAELAGAEVRFANRPQGGLLAEVKFEVEGRH
jgi:two-component system, OmpR family, sensor histidine kinase QseC